MHCQISSDRGVLRSHAEMQSSPKFPASSTHLYGTRIQHLHNAAVLAQRPTDKAGSFCDCVAAERMNAAATPGKTRPQCDHVCLVCFSEVQEMLADQPFPATRETVFRYLSMIAGFMVASGPVHNDDYTDKSTE